MSRWHAIFEREGSVRAAALLRIALGPITLLHLEPFLRDAARGVAYDDHFWAPFASWLPAPSGGLWAAMLWAGAAAAVLMSAGLFTRAASAATLTVVAWNLLLSQTHFRHNRTFLVILLVAVVLLPSGRVLSLDAFRRRLAGLAPLPDRAALWPLTLVRVQVSLVYLASGISKLVDPDWLSGLVLWDRVVRYQHVLDPTPVPAWAVDVLTARWLYWGVAPVAVLTELFVGLALWHRRSRLAGVWVALVFHLAIELSASVEVFSYAAVAALVVWATPSTRDRVLRVRGDSPRARRLVVAVRLLDWLARFRVERAGPGSPDVEVVDRDGTRLTGRDAVLFVLSRLPVPFAVAAPLRAATRRLSSPGAPRARPAPGARPARGRT